jgi:hypothetical protein
MVGFLVRVSAEVLALCGETHNSILMVGFRDGMYIANGGAWLMFRFFVGYG